MGKALGQDKTKGRRAFKTPLAQQRGARRVEGPYGKLVFMTLPDLSRFLPICLTMRDKTERQTLASAASWMATPPLAEA